MKLQKISNLSLSLSLCACERGRVVCIIKPCYETTTDGSEERSGQRRVNCAVDTSWKYAVDKVAITFSSLSTYAFWARRARATCATGVILGQKRAVHREGREGPALSSSNHPVLLSLDLNEYEYVGRVSLSLSFWEKWRGRRLPPHFFKLTTPLGRNFFSAFYTANLLPPPPHKCNENSSFERGKLDNRGNFCRFSL